MSTGAIPIVPDSRIIIPASGFNFTTDNHFVIDAEIPTAQQIDTNLAANLPAATASGQSLNLFTEDNTQATTCISDCLLQFGVTFTAETDPFHNDWPFW